MATLKHTGGFEPSDLLQKRPLNGTSLIPRLWAGSKVSWVWHTLIFNRPIEVLMPQRLEGSRGLTVSGVALLGRTFNLCFILCMSAHPTLQPQVLTEVFRLYMAFWMAEQKHHLFVLEWWQYKNKKLFVFYDWAPLKQLVVTVCVKWIEVKWWVSVVVPPS